MNDSLSREESQLSTVSDVLNWAVRHFEGAGLYYGHGTDNAWDDAVALVVHALKLPADTHKDILQKSLTQKECETILALFKKRLETIPVAYITNKATFAGLAFYVDERVIIPRSPLAECIEQRFSPWIKTEKVRRILDLCTGSGCVGIACAYAFPDAQIDAVDISKEALAVAKINIEKHQCQDRVHLIESDLFSALSNQQYDVIMSNPPYVSVDEMSALPSEYHHEPRLALAAGEAGLDCVSQIIAEAKDHLNDEGILIVEVGNAQEAVMEQYPDLPFVWLEFERGGEGVFLLSDW